MSELWRALACYAEPPGGRHGELARALELELPQAWQHTECFAFRFHPYASVYLSADGRLGGEERERIAGFWRALGRTPPGEPDFLPVMLAFHASLIDAEAAASSNAKRAAWRRARAAHFHQHLETWLPPLLWRMAQTEGSPYAAWASLLAELLHAERLDVGPAPALPRQLELAPMFSGAGVDLRQLLSALLAPARTGMIMLRDDLVSIARDLDLGTRAGERRFLLEALLAQDAAATLQRSSELARDQADTWRRLGHQLGWQPMATWWAKRAENTARELSGLAAMASSKVASGDVALSPAHDHGRARL